jgi:hypothetical protein
LRPKYCLLDFEEALAEGFHKAVPDVLVLHDFFHFIQANVKKAGQLGMKLNVSNIVTDLNTLWYKPTKEEFDVCLAEFIRQWDIRAPQYTAYFRSTWLDLHPPRKWAAYARPSDSPSGSEMFTTHLRAKLTINCRFMCCGGLQ